MAEKKNTSKKEVKKKNTTKKTNSASKNSNKKEIKKEIEVKETEVVKEKKKKKECKIKKCLNSLTIEQIAIYGIIIIIILLCVLIFVSTKNTKTSKGEDIVVKLNGKNITADDLYSTLKEKYGRDAAIDLVDDYILNKKYKTTDEMKENATNAINNYKSTYGDSYSSFLEYNGIKNENELKEMLIKNEKLTKVTEDYIKKNLTEEEMKQYYEDSIKGDIRAKHILISSQTDENATDEEKEAKKKEAKEKAEEIIEKLKNGEDFDSLAKEYSDDTGSKENGGDLGYFNTGEMVQEFEDAAYALDKNAYTTKPVETTYGYHIIMKTDLKEKPSYKKSKDTIIKKLIESKKENDSTISIKAIIDLREKYKINIKDKSIKSSYENYKNDATTTTTVAQ